jgi:hypothetical protein
MEFHWSEKHQAMVWLETLMQEMQPVERFNKLSKNNA